MTFTAPQPLTNAHDLSRFESGEPSLDEWLRRRALANQTSGASRTFVACANGEVIGFYSLASHGLNVMGARGRFRRNMPDPIPVVLLARLAIAKTHHGQGLGRALFRDACLRVERAADEIGVRGLFVHAISEEAKAFYVALGFETSPLEAMTLMITLDDIRAAR